MEDSREETRASLWTRAVAGLIGLVNPKAALRWSYSRDALLSYQAASRKGPHGSWRGSKKTADELINKDLRDVAARARDLVRNSSIVKGIVRRSVDNVVFSGIVPQVQFKREDGTKDKERNNRIEQHWRSWAEAEEVLFWEIERLVLRHQWSDGGIFVHWFVDTDLLARGLVPLGLEVLEMDLLDTSVHGQQANGNRARYGIEFNAKGRPVAYHLFTEHPGDGFFFTLQKSRRIPAEQIIHVFDRERASQTRGMSWLAPLVMDLFEIDDYKGAVRQTARLCASIAYWLETDNLVQYASSLPGFVDKTVLENAYQGCGVPEKVSAASVNVLPPGMKHAPSQSTQPGPDYAEFIRTELQGSSAGTGQSYEAMSGDYTSASYASARSASLEERRCYRVQQKFLIRRLHARIWRIWCAALALSGLEPGVPAVIPVSWLTPGWPWVDPRNDAAAAEKKLSLRIISRRRLAAENGEDLDDITDELAEEEGDLKKKGLLPQEGDKDA